MNTTLPVKQQPGPAPDWNRRIQAATLYNQVGNMRLVSETLSIQYDVLCDWKASEWWPRLMDEVRSAKATKRTNKIDEILTKSIDLIEDRISNGDIIVTLEGDFKRVPVKLKDAANLTKDLLKHQIEQEELANKVVGRVETVQETLAMVAKELKRLNQQATKDQAVTVEFKEK